MNFLQLDSELDMSRNFIFDKGFEARFVRRTDDYFICYLSSHTGCNKSCRFCHLTQTGQTGFLEASIDELIDQATAVFQYYATQKPAERVHINWMARGEPLASSVIRGCWPELSNRLLELCARYGLAKERVTFKMSSIFPSDENVDLSKFEINKPDIYYSLYSLDPHFRRRWIPKSEDPVAVFKKLKAYSDSGGRVIIHHALIENENSSEDDATLIGDFIKSYDLNCKINIVRYNPFDARCGEEASEVAIQSYFNRITPYMKQEGSRIVPRVGFDVKASCGMFVEIK